jgi:hypothetical protein
MGKSIPTRRGLLALEARDPRGGTLTVVFSQSKLLAVGKRSIGQTKEAAWAVPMVLKDPTAIFEGLLREPDEPMAVYDNGWRCYCGIPVTAYDELGNPHDPWPGQVMLVFVSEDSVVYNWYWTKCAEEDEKLPEKYKTRFRERLL